MNAKQLTPGFSVSEQIAPADVAAIAAVGFRSIICARPDGEGFGQPKFAEIEAAAKAVGLKAAYVPIVPGQMTERDVRTFAELVKMLPAPVLGYCKSGARAAGLLQAVHSMKSSS